MKKLSKTVLLIDYFFAAYMILYGIALLVNKTQVSYIYSGILTLVFGLIASTQTFKDTLKK